MSISHFLFMVWSEGDQRHWHGCSTGNPVRPRGNSLSPCERGIPGTGTGPWAVGDAHPWGCPDSPGVGPQQPAAAASSLSPSVSPMRLRVVWLASQRCPSVFTLRVPFQLCPPPKDRAGLSRQKLLSVAGVHFSPVSSLPLSPKHLQALGSITGCP